MFFPKPRCVIAGGPQRSGGESAEFRLRVEDFILPFFIREGSDGFEPIPSLAGVNRWTITALIPYLARVVQAGIPSILLFGVYPDGEKDQLGTPVWRKDNLIEQAVRAIKKAYPQLVVITDVCLCGGTDHGHCGLVHGEEILNDESLQYLGRMAVSHARAGADFLAPSSMMDFQVKAIRQALDQEGYQTPILSYAAKYASAFYGPFRGAVDSSPRFGDRATYQMDPPNAQEALEEVALDLEEGAKQVMVKPAMPYLDIIRRVKERWPSVPLVAYQVSGEYMMIQSGAKSGLFDYRRAMDEALLAIKRAGADQIISYAALDWAEAQKADRETGGGNV
jgi:porphobilinogen synthase